MIPVAIAPIVEHVGGILAIGSVSGRTTPKTPPASHLLGDGLASISSAVRRPAVTTYAEVTGAVMLTKNYNPVVMTWAAGFAILMAFVGKFGALLQTIPLPVMGGIMVLLFGSIAGIGLKTLLDARVNLSSARNLCIVSVTLVTGIGGLGVTIGSFALQGISLCGVLAVCSPARRKSRRRNRLRRPGAGGCDGATNSPYVYHDHRPTQDWRRPASNLFERRLLLTTRFRLASGVPLTDSLACGAERGHCALWNAVYTHFDWLKAHDRRTDDPRRRPARVHPSGSKSACCSSACDHMSGLAWAGRKR